MAKFENLNHETYNNNLFKKYAWFYDYLEFLILPILKNISDIDIPLNSRVLDVACGTGTLSISFANKGHEVVGIDLSPEMLSKAKLKKSVDQKVKFLCQDASKLKFHDSYFDLSVISLALHDMPFEVGIKVISEMIRTTKNKGLLIILDYHHPKNSLVSYFGLKIAKIWESKYFEKFYKSSIENYSNNSQILLKSKKLFLLENLQLLTFEVVK